MCRPWLANVQGRDSRANFGSWTKSPAVLVGTARIYGVLCKDRVGFHWSSAQIANQQGWFHLQAHMRRIRARCSQPETRHLAQACFHAARLIYP